LVSIALNNLGKKYNREWIFRHLSHTINPGEKLVILGGNGSGKSTLLQVISTFIVPNEGSVIYQNVASNPAVIEQDDIKKHISFASPYLQLVEDFTLHEMIEHAGEFKPFVKNMAPYEVMERIEMTASKNKFIKQFSSGMKQRLKLGLAILADTSLLLLDEPASNLDKNAIAWYRQLVSDHSKDRTVIVCSNAITDEYFFCDREINVMDYKAGRIKSSD
jgi:ABC-type multidrug transport system ATPase subunit